MTVGLLGAGTVGGGVCEILRMRGDFLAQHGAQLKIVKIAMRDTAKKRDFELPAGCEIVTDPVAVARDPNVEMVVELMGGVTVAKECIMAAIAAGKHVVTGNKALIAAHLPEIQAALKANPCATFGYEAAVCGGIPIIQALRHDYIGDKISSIMGIMNGTTNFILSKMESEGAAYGDVLAEAQRLGYAETPPDFDVEGWDARSKLAILCKLAFGVHVEEKDIPCTGITRIGAEDFLYAKQLKSTVKILGVASQAEDGSVSAYVSICIVPFTNQLSGVGGCLNCVAVTSHNLGVSVFSGPGAGRLPTANAVVSDMVMLGAGGGRGDPFVRHAQAPVVSEVRGRFYIRFLVCDALGIIRTLAQLAEAAGVSIHAVLQSPIVDSTRVPFVITTDVTTLSAVKIMCAGAEKQVFNLEKPLVMPLFDC